jgi:predicted Fe-S protein YdhL (DUF1289 family)
MIRVHGGDMTTVMGIDAAAGEWLAGARLPDLRRGDNGTVPTRRTSRPLTQETSGRKRVYLEIPANWDQMTDEQQHQVAEAMAEEMQRALGITDKSEQGEQTPAPELEGEHPAP